MGTGGLVIFPRWRYLRTDVVIKFFTQSFDELIRLANPRVAGVAGVGIYTISKGKTPIS